MFTGVPLFDTYSTATVVLSSYPSAPVAATEFTDVVKKRARTYERELCDAKLKLAMSKSSEDD